MADTPIPGDVLKAAREHSARWANGSEGSARMIAAAILAERAAQAERIRELERQLRGCTWYWPEDDTSSETCTESAQEVVQNAYDYKTPEGEVVAVARGGVVAVSYCAYLPPADDSDSDDDFWIEENTREAAKAKIDAELARRSALGGNNG
jgi:hypothetical protein